MILTTEETLVIFEENSFHREFDRICFSFIRSRLFSHSSLLLRPANVFLLCILGHPRRYLLCSTDFYEKHTITSATGRNKTYEYYGRHVHHIKAVWCGKKNSFLRDRGGFLPESQQ